MLKGRIVTDSKITLILSHGPKQMNYGEMITK